MKRFFLIFVVVALFSCTDDESDQPLVNLGYEYFPTDLGRFVEYKVDSIWHDQPVSTIPGIHDTSTYYLREVLESLVTDAEEEPSIRIERFKKDSLDDEWELVDIWFAKRTAQNAEKVEENVRYIKMAFPINTSAQWDLNALNFKDEWLTNYDSLYTERTFGELNFPSTVTAVQRINKNLIEDELAYEVYAQGVGLVLRYERDLETQLSYDLNPIADNIRSGHEFRWEVIDYGVE
jgi:hypothetical protein